MKKILVVLLILSVAWGVFAQDGSWRVSGNVEIGTRVDFDPDKVATDDKAIAGGSSYNNSWDTPRGRFALIYGTFVNDGALSAGFKWNTRGGGQENEPFFSYNGENFAFSTALYGNSVIGAGSHWSGSQNINDNFIKRLWGNYKFVNGVVFVQVAFRAEEEEFWISDTTAGSEALGTNYGALTVNGDRGTTDTRHHGFFGKPSTFTYTDSDGANYLLGQINLASLNFGLMIPRVFGSIISNKDQGYADPSPYQRTQGGELVNDVLKESIFGLKFNMSPVEFAAQFKMRDYGIYFGGKAFVGPLTVGASFSGILNPEKDADGNYVGNFVDKFIKIGGDLNFNGGVFDAGVAASYERVTDAEDSGIYYSLIRIQPRFSYNVIPSHLCFALDAGFYFANDINGDVTLKDTVWAIQPQLFWTFLGTGARNGYGWAGPFYQGGPTGLIARYRIFSQPVEEFRSATWDARNQLDVVFMFNF
jgi:hypothetical protein